MDITMPRVIGPRDGKAGFLGSIGVRFLIDGADSGGGFSLVEHPMSPRALGAPLHRHAREDEYSYVTQGRVGALLGEHVLKRVLAHSSSSRVTSGTPSGTRPMSLPGSSRSSRRPGSNATSPNS